MKEFVRKAIVIVTVFLLSVPLNAQKGPAVWFDFEKVESERKEVVMVRGETYLPKERFHYVYEKQSGERCEMVAKYQKSVSGVSGNAVLFDGFTSHVLLNKVPHIQDDFSVEAWIAMGAYPTFICPLVDYMIDPEEGYYNGYQLCIDAMGRLALRIATDGRIEEVRGKESIPLNTWTHVAGVYTIDGGMKIYVNGELAGSLMPDARFKPIDPEYWIEPPMIFGKSRGKSRPYGTIRPEGTQLVYSFFDGLMDEVKVYNKAISEKEIQKSIASAGELKKPELPERILPSGVMEPGKFGAITQTIPYFPAWDAPWHVGDEADVSVRFDETACKFVFWRGTSYIPCWVTENRIWYNNGFNEGWNEHGSCEPMSDKRTIYSQVKVVESNEARVVVLWRYGLVDNWNTFAFEDPETRWGDWTEEKFVIYPNMIGVRVDALYSNAPRAEHEWQESMMVMGWGQRPDDVLENEALSLANIDGDHHTYSWEHEIPPHFPPDPKNANIQVVNTKSEYKPFSAVRPQDNPNIDIYSGEIRRDVCVFPWWNHWPVAPKPTDGRYAMFADRASHASLSHWIWGAYEETDNSMTKLMLNGLTNKTVEELVPLVKSWSNPPEIKFENAEIASGAYNPAELAFVVDCKNEGTELSFSIEASEESPIVDPAFVVNNWGELDATVQIDGTEMKEGNDFRMDFKYGIENTDLIIWLRKEARVPVKISIIPNK